MNVKIVNVNEADKENINELEGKKWTGGLYTEWKNQQADR